MQLQVTVYQLNELIISRLGPNVWLQALFKLYSLMTSDEAIFKSVLSISSSL